MDRSAELAIAAQHFDALLRMRVPEEVPTWSPSEAQRDEYIRVAESVGRTVSEFRSRESQAVAEMGEVRNVVPTGHLKFLQAVEPRMPAIKEALNTLDPGGALLREFIFDEWRWRGRILRTFEMGLEQVQDLLDRNPEWEDARGFVPNRAREILDSDLLRFEPDQWLNRVRDLKPVRSDRANFHLPGHVRLRLEEIFRAYVFGMNISIPGMARSVLDYSIRDNAGRLRIDLLRPPGVDGRRKDKALSELCEDVSAIARELELPMGLIRELGNEYLHPKKKGTEALFNAEQAAREVLPALVRVTGKIYGMGR